MHVSMAASKTHLQAGQNKTQNQNQHKRNKQTHRQKTIYALVHWEPAKIEETAQCKVGWGAPLTPLPSNTKFLHHFVYALLQRPYCLANQPSQEKEVRSLPHGGSRSVLYIISLHCPPPVNIAGKTRMPAGTPVER